MEMHKNYVNGKFIAHGGGDRIAVLNPARGDVVGEIPDTSQDIVQQAIDAAKSAQIPWGKRPPIERAGHLRRIAAKIREKTEVIATAISQEQGKVLELARVEVAFTADYLDYMSEWARRMEGEIIPSDRAGENIFMFRQPIGVIGGILPWNFPFFLIARKMAPALITGNTIVIKPSEETPNNAAMFTQLLAETDLPAGVFNMIYGRGATAGQALAGSPDIGMISFTGSVETGSAIMAAAARNITKVNLELGGKAPAIVMDDADIDLAVKAITASRVINSGQVCNCTERVYVHSQVADEFTSKFATAMQRTSYGDPLGKKPVDMGPLINAAAARKVQGMVDRAIAGGAQAATGGSMIEQDGGFYFEPTVLVNCQQDMEIMHKEIFGPVAPVHIIHDLDEAIAKANDSTYGLTSSIYTRNLGSAMRAANEIRCGETYINRENFEAMQGFHAGTARSGIGGADGKHGLYEHTQTHMVYIQNES
ncbi:aldehyde dehydrogenase [Pollutimonas bauzanensis]|uniref:Lactaldehyde dehydrogenase / glycolaldehyde dehydrogenase n=1 Tax=Pollutimonas bauzanensis TaxID=658167 RepID=A0A1M5R0C1_9BURK|nr:aldehyde dehydrogenase [Pollutimonas bauzanensis]SHH19825.1 lactaldehyde dehydrogenase / glycolaldehyde dehydrogenase [Pollutimonas bauzanensis]